MSLTKPTNVRLKIEQFKAFAKIGCYAWEKVILQTIIISLKLESTSIIDYDLCTEHITRFVSSKHFDFIEELAQALFDSISQNFDTNYCALEITKPSGIPNAKGASVFISSN